MSMPLPLCDRLTRTDYSEYLDSDGPCGRVTFRVDGHALRADRFLLAARSEYFDRMLRSGMSEGNADEVAIPRASLAAFHDILRFIYSAGHPGDAMFKEADPLEVLHLAVEFLLEDLVRLCEWRLLQGLQNDSALSVFASIASVRVKVPVLAERSVELLRGRMQEICGSDEFRTYNQNPDVMRELIVALDEPSAKKRKLNV